MHGRLVLGARGHGSELVPVSLIPPEPKAHAALQVAAHAERLRPGNPVYDRLAAQIRAKAGVVIDATYADRATRREERPEQLWAAAAPLDRALRALHAVLVSQEGAETARAVFSDLEPLLAAARAVRTRRGHAGPGVTAMVRSTYP